MVVTGAEDRPLHALACKLLVEGNILVIIETALGAIVFGDYDAIEARIFEVVHEHGETEGGNVRKVVLHIHKINIFELLLQWNFSNENGSNSVFLAILFDDTHGLITIAFQIPVVAVLHLVCPLHVVAVDCLGIFIKEELVLGMKMPPVHQEGFSEAVGASR